jgi:hypothetical protein
VRALRAVWDVFGDMFYGMKSGLVLMFPLLVGLAAGGLTWLILNCGCHS